MTAEQLQEHVLSLTPSRFSVSVVDESPREQLFPSHLESRFRITVHGEPGERWSVTAATSAEALDRFRREILPRLAT